ncbi:hypothetical protein SteCoe_11026 [Stentor coeruleus]|uniref:Uncharacterized protein n=1 Tax=Stentor coeruleus TaxID=5963 RepID=A0A1R2CE29_9CILI|nr:hypothetical protein SteCoe_11026 [Stentor coeruleus]
MEDHVQNFSSFSPQRYFKVVGARKPRRIKILNPCLKIHQYKKLSRKSSNSPPERPVEEKIIKKSLSSTRAASSEKRLKSLPKHQIPSFPIETQNTIKSGVSIYKLEKSQSSATITVKSYRQPSSSNDPIPSKAHSLIRNPIETLSKPISEISKISLNTKTKDSYNMKTQILEFNNNNNNSNSLSSRKNLSKKSFTKNEPKAVYPFTKLARLFTTAFMQKPNLYISSARIDT